MALALEPLSQKIIGAAIEVHRELGPGLLESVYEACLHSVLIETGHGCKRQVEVPVIFRGKSLDAALRIDLLVDDLVVLELKAVKSVEPIHEARLLTYMKLARKPLGLLININVEILTNGLKRRILSEYLPPPSPPSASSAPPR